MWKVVRTAWRPAPIHGRARLKEASVTALIRSTRKRKCTGEGKDRSCERGGVTKEVECGFEVEAETFRTMGGQRKTMKS